MIKFNLKKMMKQNKFTLKDLSRKTNLSINTLSLLSTGKSKGVQFDTLEKIINALNCEVSDLIIVDYGYKLIKILNVEFITDDFLPKSENQSYIKSTYLNEDNEEESVIFSIFDSFKSHELVISISGVFPKDSLTSGKYEEYSTEKGLRTHYFDIFREFILLNLKILSEKNNQSEFIEKNSDKTFFINLDPYVQGSFYATGTSFDNLMSNDPIKVNERLEKYVKIDNEKLYIYNDFYKQAEIE